MKLRTIAVRYVLAFGLIVLLLQNWFVIQELLTTAWQQVQPYLQSYWENVAKNWDVVYEVVPAMWTWTVRLFINIAVVLLWILGLILLCGLVSVFNNELPKYIKAKTREAESRTEIYRIRTDVHEMRMHLENHRMRMRLGQAEAEAHDEQARYFAILRSDLERKQQREYS